MCCRKYVTCSNRVGQLVCGVGYVAMERGKAMKDSRGGRQRREENRGCVVRGLMSVE